MQATGSISLNSNLFSGDQGPYGEASIHRLVEALDNYIELPQRDVDGPFLMPVDNLVSVPGRGTVAIGKEVLTISLSLHIE